MSNPLFNNSEPNALYKARCEAALARLAELQVSASELYAYDVAKNAIECTLEMQQDDPEIDMPGTTEAYMEANEASNVDEADKWLTYLLAEQH